jgi:D-3-phosphoglycerate dehydrogenase / 2-oxoglutarate reductase
MRILLTTTSYQDTPGKHHDCWPAALSRPRPRAAHRGADARPHQEQRRLRRPAQRRRPHHRQGHRRCHAATKLKVIAKYGIGLDSIDVKHATSKKIPVLFTPGVNHTTVAEHAFGLMIALAKHFWPHLRSTKKGEWKRITGNELFGKTIAVLGVGRIGKEVIKRAARST